MAYKKLKKSEYNIEKKLVRKKKVKFLKIDYYYCYY